VLRLLGPNLKYLRGGPIGPDIVTWFHDRRRQDPTLLMQWLEEDASLAEQWAAADQANREFLSTWAETHPRDLDQWRRENPDLEEPAPADLAALFFARHARGETSSWPQTDGKDLQSLFFERWWQAHPQVEFQPVPADMVMASGSGLDPHITRKNALYQLDRVAGKWARDRNLDRDQVASEIRALLQEHVEAPLGGLVGVELVNVMEVNLALPGRMERLAQRR
jgi:K+-transporting ATPase ATPase C chain